jgi:hypothetical protein
MRPGPLGAFPALPPPSPPLRSPPAALLLPRPLRPGPRPARAAAGAAAMQWSPTVHRALTQPKPVPQPGQAETLPLGERTGPKAPAAPPKPGAPRPAAERVQAGRPLATLAPAATTKPTGGALRQHPQRSATPPLTPARPVAAPAPPADASAAASSRTPTAHAQRRRSPSPPVPLAARRQPLARSLAAASPAECPDSPDAVDLRPDAEHAAAACAAAARMAPPPAQPPRRSPRSRKAPETWVGIAAPRSSAALAPGRGAGGRGSAVATVASTTQPPGSSPPRSPPQPTSAAGPGRGAGGRGGGRSGGRGRRGHAATPLLHSSPADTAGPSNAGATRPGSSSPPSSPSGSDSPGSPPQARARAAQRRSQNPGARNTRGLRRAQQTPRLQACAGPRPRTQIPQVIPLEAHGPWAQALGEAMRQLLDVAAYASGPQAADQVDAAMDALEDIPRRVLATDGRSSKARARHITARVARLAEGIPLEDEEGGNGGVEAARSHRRTLSAAQLLARRIQKCLAQGSITRAARALAEQPLADPTLPATIEGLRDKHPVAEAPTPLVDDAAPLQVDAETFARVLHRVESKRGAAAGPSGLTYEHLTAAFKYSEECRDAGRGIINLILSGQLPRHRSLLDSSLIGLQKPDSGVRPIAIGEVWFRLAGLCALEACADVGRSLAPLQLAVGVPGGAEAVAHAVKAAMAADPGACLLTVDVANAFNSVDRNAVLAAVKQRVPCLLPYVQWAYGAATDLHVVGAPEGTLPVKSSTGVRQGDPMGPFLFALALQPALEHTAEDATQQAPGAVVVSFADDVSMVARPVGLRAAFEAFTVDAAVVGLGVQPLKCAISGGPPEAAARLAAELGVRHRPEGVTICGAPVGSDEYVAGVLHERAAGIIARVEKLRRLPLAKQSQWVLLHRSLSLQMVHLMRTTPWQQLEPSIRAVEDAICSAASALFQVPAEAVNQAHEQMRLPLRHAGFGLRRVQPIEADAARLAGAARAQAAVQDGPEACHPFSGATRQPLLDVWHGVFDFGAEEHGWAPSARELPAQFVLDELPYMQQVISRQCGDAAGAAFLASFDLATDEGMRGAARVRSAASGTSAAWLTAVPTVPTLRLTDSDFVMAGRHRLGLGVPAPVGSPPCVCGAADSSKADHALSCRLNAGYNTMRHDSGYKAWCRIIRRAGCKTAVEPLYNRYVPGAGLKRADIECVWPRSEHITMLDCVITHPAAASYVRRASRTSGAAAEQQEDNKIREHADFSQSDAYEFVPLAMESYGRLGLKASRFLSALGDEAARNGRVSKARFVRNARQELGCALCRGNNRAYHRTMQRIGRSVGCYYEFGSPEPIEDAGEF